MSKEMPPGRWAYLKALKPSKGRYVHVSSFANMVPDPRGYGYPVIPYVEPGVTLNLKRGDQPRTNPADTRGFRSNPRQRKHKQ